MIWKTAQKNRSYTFYTFLFFKNVCVCQRVCSGGHRSFLFLLLSAPRCVSFPVSPTGLRSLSSEALVGCGGKSAGRPSNTPCFHAASLIGRLLPTPQVTTLVTSVFLVVKVILSNVSDPDFTLSPLHFHTRCVSVESFDLRAPACCCLPLPPFRLGVFHEWKLYLWYFCSFRITQSLALNSCCPRMHLATCCQSRRSWWPGWRPGSSILRC